MMAPSLTTFNTGVRQGCVLAPTLFNTCMDHVLGKMSVNSGCGVSFGCVRITDLDFADDQNICEETPEVIAGALDFLNEEADPFDCESGSKPMSRSSVTSWMRSLSQFLQP